MSTMICSYCKQEKYTSDFTAGKGTCKECRNAQRKHPRIYKQEIYKQDVYRLLMSLLVYKVKRKHIYWSLSRVC